jgi:hypothetical protein
MRVREWLAKSSTFEGWMAITEVVDALRIFPRFVLIYVLTYVCADMWHLSFFYFGLPSADKAQGNVVAFVSAVTAIDGMLLTAAFALYNASGRDWAEYHARKKALKEES